MKPNRNYQSLEHLSQSTNLIYKIANELKLKYKNVFFAAKYSDDQLYNDVKNALITEQVPLIFNLAFHPVEINILNIIRNKFPEHKILSARNVTRLGKKNNKNNNEEMNDLEYEKLKEEELREKQMEKRKEELEKLKEKAYLRKAELKKMINKKNKSPNKKITEEEEEFNPRIKNHELIDQYKNKVKNDLQGKIFKYDDEKYKSEQKRIKEEKREKCLEIQNFLDAQINEKHNRQIDEIKLNNAYMNEEFKDYVKWREKEYEKNMGRVKKYREYQNELAQNLRDKEEKRRFEQNEQLKINNTIRQQYNINPEEEVDKIINKQRMRKNNSMDVERYNIINHSTDNIYNTYNNINTDNNINNNITNNNNISNISNNNNNDNIKNKNENDNNENINNKSYMENDAIKQRVLARIQEQQNAAKYLKQIYDSHEKNLNERYNKFLYGNNNETEKKKELEIADKKRQEKIEEYRQFMDDKIKKKNLDNQKKKQEDLEYRMYLNKSYNEYLNEKNGRRKKQLEQYEKYRKELEAQIQEKKIRGKEQLKYTEII